MTTKAYNGGALTILDDMYDAHFKGCLKAIEKNPDLIIGYDIETGFPFVWTKKERDDFMDFFESCRPKSSEKPPGKVIIFGTGGAIEPNKFEDFYKHDQK